MSIEAKVICDSTSPGGIRLTTLELKFHRFILPEFNTHRMFSRNASSSRAIPIEKMIKQVQLSPAMPIHWGENQPGMQAGEEISPDIGKTIWNLSAYEASDGAKSLHNIGYHKQIVNRLLEPFQWMKVIVTATEWDNFFKLRLHPDAQPEIQELARCMKQAIGNSIPQELSNGFWHLPYVTTDECDKWRFEDMDLQTLIKCSVARCARISYLNHDNSNPNIEKDIALADKLLAAGHMSPLEHQATPMYDNKGNESPWYTWPKGITHQDKDGFHWSGNFRGFLQYRQLI